MLAIVLNLIKLNDVKSLRIHDRKFSSISMSSILHATLKVQNLKRSQDFYTDCLGVKKVAEGKDFIHLSFENSLSKNFKLVLTQSENLNIGNVSIYILNLSIFFSYIFNLLIGFYGYRY